MFFFGANRVRFGIITIGAMLAAAFTAITAFQVIGFGKNNVAFLAQIIILFV